MAESSTDIGEFKRARTEVQINTRKTAILSAAIELLRTKSPLDITIRQLSKSAGIAPSGIYRYFENMESIFLEVHLNDLELIVESWEKNLVKFEADLSGISEYMANSLLSNDRYLLLLLLTPTLIERELSVERLVEHKMQLVQIMQRAAIALHSSGLKLDIDKSVKTFGRIIAFAMGLQPLANPSQPALKAMEKPELSIIKLDMKEELTQGIEIILKGSILHF